MSCKSKQRLRSAAASAGFCTEGYKRLQRDIATLTQLLDGVINNGSCDFVAAVGEQLPVRVCLKMMGTPDDRLAEFRELVREVFAPAGTDVMLQLTRLRRVADVTTDVILERQHTPKDDLVSMLWTLDVEGEPITYELMEDYCVLLFLAGLDTAVNAIGFGIRHLAIYQDFQRELKANPELIPEATEELLRR